MNFLLYLLSKKANRSRRPYREYPHESDDDECILINDMYENENGLDKIRELNFGNIYSKFLGPVNSQDEQKEVKRVEVSEERKCRPEEISENEFEELKKRLEKDCPRKKECHRCSIDQGDCPLLNPWKKEGGEFKFKHSYQILGEYQPELKKVVLYKKNIDDACYGEPTYNGVLSTYIHELFHAYFHYITEQKKAKRNYIREIEEAMAEFSTLVFLRVMENLYDGNEWSEILNWTIKSIGEKQKTVGDLPAYGFGLHLFENLSEAKAFDWINKYAERLGYIDEEDELVKQYKQMVCPCYPSEPDQCMKLLRKILFETNNKPIKPRGVKVNRKSIMFSSTDFENEWDSIIQEWMNNVKVLCPFTGKSKNLTIDHLPEPYYGDMDNCSIVMINLNPGVGQDYQHWSNQSKSGTTVNEVKINKYSVYAKPFPLIFGGTSTPSSKWWQSRNAWMNRILNNMGINTNKKPFAIELCPLHSKQFKISNPINYVNGIKSVNPRIDVVEAIKWAICHSESKIGLAIGKHIYNTLIFNGFKDITKGSFFPVIGNHREYHIIEKEGVQVLCTWAQGGNRVPSAIFESFEKSLLNSLT